MALLESLIQALSPKSEKRKETVILPKGFKLPDQEAALTTPPASGEVNALNLDAQVPEMFPTPVPMQPSSVSMGVSLPSSKRDPELEAKTLSLKKQLVDKIGPQLESQEAQKDLQKSVLASRLQGFAPQLNVTPALAWADAQLGTNVAKTIGAPKNLDEFLAEQGSLENQATTQEGNLADKLRESLATLQSDAANRDYLKVALANQRMQESALNREQRGYERVQSRVEPISKLITEFETQKNALVASAESGDAQQITSGIQTLIKLSGGAANSSDKEAENALIKDINGFTERLKQKFGGDIAKASPAELQQFKNSVLKFGQARTQALRNQVNRLKQREMAGPYGQHFAPGGWGDASINALLEPVAQDFKLPANNQASDLDARVAKELAEDRKRGK